MARSSRGGDHEVYRSRGGEGELYRRRGGNPELYRSRRDHELYEGELMYRSSRRGDRESYKEQLLPRSSTRGERQLYREEVLARRDRSLELGKVSSYEFEHSHSPGHFSRERCAPERDEDVYVDQYPPSRGGCTIDHYSPLETPAGRIDRYLRPDARDFRAPYYPPDDRDIGAPYLPPDSPEIRAPYSPLGAHDQDSRSHHFTSQRHSSRDATSYQPYKDYVDISMLANPSGRHANAGYRRLGDGQRRDTVLEAPDRRQRHRGSRLREDPILFDITPDGAFDVTPDGRLVSGEYEYFSNGRRVLAYRKPDPFLHEYDEKLRSDSPGQDWRLGGESLYEVQERGIPYQGGNITSDLKRRYSMVGNNASMEVDLYSNYREAKFRRTAADGLKKLSRRERREIREREGNPPIVNRPVRSVWRRRDSGSKDDNAIHLDDRARISLRANEREKNPEECLKELNLVQTIDNAAKEVRGKGHELANDSDDENMEEERNAVSDDALDGMIFGCTSATFHECMRRQLFGLPAKMEDLVTRVAPGTKLFLFNFDTKEFSGIFVAVSYGGMNLIADAYCDVGRFPAQVQVECLEHCPNLPLTRVKPIIQDNYMNLHKFRFDLSASQVKRLVTVFRQAAKLERRRPLEQKNLHNGYGIEHLPFHPVRDARESSLPPEACFRPSGVSSMEPLIMTEKTVIEETNRVAQEKKKGKIKKSAERKMQQEPDNGPNVLQRNNCILVTAPADPSTDALECIGATSTPNHHVTSKEIVETAADGLEVMEEGVRCESVKRKVGVDVIMSKEGDDPCSITAGHSSSLFLGNTAIEIPIKENHTSDASGMISNNVGDDPSPLMDGGDRQIEPGKKQSFQDLHILEGCKHKHDTCETNAMDTNAATSKLTHTCEDAEAVKMVKNGADIKLPHVAKVGAVVVVANDAIVFEIPKTDREEDPAASVEAAEDEKVVIITDDAVRCATLAAGKDERVRPGHASLMIANDSMACDISKADQEEDAAVTKASENRKPPWMVRRQR